MGIFRDLMAAFRPNGPEAAPQLREEPPAPRAEPVLRPRAFGEFDHFDDLKDPRLAMFLRAGAEAASGTTVTAETAMRVGAVYGCVRIIAGAVATMPLDVKRRRENIREDADDHALWRILRRRPNRWMKPAQFRRMMQAHLLLRGNAYSLIVRGSRGQVTDLIPMHPDKVKTTQNTDLTLRYEYWQANGRKIDLPQDEVFHLTGMTLDGITGVSVITYARESVGLAIATANHGAAFFRNGTHVGSVLKHKGELSQEARDRLKADLQDFRLRGERAKTTMVLEEGMEFEPLGMTAEDAQFVETMKMTRTDIGMFFGVPPHMLGDTEKNSSWGTGIEAQSRGFVAYTLEDWLTTWEEGVNADLIGDDEPAVYARFNRAALVRGDFKTRWEGYVKGLQWGVYSPDDIRALEDENPRPDGKGRTYYEPPNTAGQASSEKDGPHDDPQAA